MASVYQVQKEAEKKGVKPNYKLRVKNRSMKQTPGGLGPGDIKKNKQDKLVSKRQSAAGARAYRANGLAPYSKATKQIGYVPKKGTKEYKEWKQIARENGAA